MSETHHAIAKIFFKLTTRDAALDVGIPKWYIASEQRNSLTEDRKTARPSPNLECGVFPLPLSCNSTCSPLAFV